ncbi:MAG: acyltransferase family protein [Myxococcota bacterium]
MTPVESPRVPALDGLRGVAILMVLFFHATVVEPEGALEGLVYGAFRNFGWAGVDLFFVLSGFLITGVLLDAKRGPRPLRSFYARRVLRIFPVYYGFLALAFLLAPAFAGDAFRPGDDAVWYWLYLQNFATAAAGDWSHGRFLNLFWSLAIEEQFYLLWPWVVLRCDLATLRRVCVAAFAASLALRCALVLHDAAPVAVYVLTPARLDGLAAGAFVAVAARQSGGLAVWQDVARRVAWGCAAGVAGLVVWQRGFDYALPGTATLGLGLLALGFAAALVRLQDGGAPSATRRLIEGRGLRLFGRTSYALYVIHQVVLVVATRWLAEQVFARHWPDAPLLALQVAVWTTAIGGSLLLAMASWRFVEAPILGLKRHFPYTREAAGSGPG